MNPANAIKSTCARCNAAMEHGNGENALGSGHVGWRGYGHPGGSGRELAGGFEAKSFSGGRPGEDQVVGRRSKFQRRNIAGLTERIPMSEEIGELSAGG